MNKPSETEPSKSKENILYFKLPFTGKFCKFTENKLQNLTMQFCKEGTNIKIVFSTFKLASFFSTKGKAPYGPKSYVIYKFLCACSNSGLMNIWKLIKILIFTDATLKVRNANQFVNFQMTLVILYIAFLILIKSLQHRF